LTVNLTINPNSDILKSVLIVISDVRNSKDGNCITVVILGAIYQLWVKKMSKQTKKLLQLAAEYYFTFRAQQEIEKKNRSISDRSKILKKDFENYLKLSGLSLTEFKDSVYYKNINDQINLIIDDWIYSVWPKDKLEISNCMKEGRANKEKSDFIIHLSSGIVVKYSLKNYDDKKIGSIQVGSGTWVSAILNILFSSNGVGSWTYDNQKFTSKGKDRVKVIDSIKKWCNQNNISSSLNIVKAFENAIKRNDLIKQKYVIDSKTEFLTEQVQAEFEKDCDYYGHAQINDTLNFISEIPSEIIRERFIEISGFGENEAELLCLWTEEYLDSLSNSKFGLLRKRLNSKKITITASKHAKNIRLVAEDKKGKILAIDIPFTYNKNGAWHDENQPRFCSKSKSLIQPGQRRPGKAKEMNTSTNSWMRLKEAL